MILPKRLEAVITFIDGQDCVADIGCDHGYLTNKILQLGCPFVQATDNKKGPLESAQSHLINYALGDSQELVFSLSDGLSELNCRVDTVVICGMGGQLITAILNDSLQKAQACKKIILQANNKTCELRRFLSNNNFLIYGEKIVIENNKFYEIIACQFSENAGDLSAVECLFGPHLLRAKTAIFIDKWQKQLTFYQKLKNIDLDEKRLTEVEMMIKCINDNVM